LLKKQYLSIYKYILNFISKIGIDAISKIFAIITLPIIARGLGPDNFGLYNYALVIVSYFGLATDWGYTIYGTSEICKGIDEQEIVNKIISLQFLFGVISFLILILLGTFFLNHQIMILVLILSLSFFIQPYIINYYFVAKNKLYFYSLAQFIGQLFFLFMIILIFVKEPSIYYLIIFSVLNNFINAIILIFYYLKNHKLKLIFSIKENVTTFKEAFKLGLSVKMEGITASVIPLIIGILLTNYALGIYSAAYKIYLILLTVVQSFSLTMMPSILTNLKNLKTLDIKKVNLLFYCYLTFGLFLGTISFILAPTIIKILYGEKYLDAIVLMRLFSFTIGLWPIIMFIGTLFIANNRKKLYFILTFSSALSSVIYSLAFISTLKLFGAGLVLLCVAITSILVGVYLLLLLFKQNNLLSILTKIISPFLLIPNAKSLFNH
jgi:polysaccharide transporter, PST family